MLVDDMTRGTGKLRERAIRKEGIAITSTSYRAEYSMTEYGLPQP